MRPDPQVARARGQQAPRVRVLDAILWCSPILVGSALALWWRPEPHSDWLYYWNAAGSPDSYLRGGVGLWLLAVPKWLGASPVVSALVLNIVSVIALMTVMRRSDRSRLRLPSWLFIAYLFLLSPFLGLVQLDIAAAAALGVAFRGTLGEGGHRPAWHRFAIALGGVGFAVSTKPQYALVIWMMCGLAAVLALARFRRPDSKAVAFVAMLMAGSLLGFALDMGMRQVADQPDSMRTTSAVTLYAGLLESGTTRESGCGEWSVDALQAAHADMDRPLPVAVGDRLGSKPPSHWLAVVRCKLPEVLLPPPFAVDWLRQAPNIRAWMESQPQPTQLLERYWQVLRVEKILYSAVVASILVLVFGGWVRRKARLDGTAPLPVLWVLSFWMVHLVFEIQGRYFLGMLLLAPLLVALCAGWSTTGEEGAD